MKEHSGPTEIPKPVSRTSILPKPKPVVKEEKYTVVVNEVPVHELLFALARDAKKNVDIHPGIKGKVTLNAIQQTLSQILNRISEQVPVRYILDKQNIVISPDLPFFKNYKINYVNMARNSSSSVSVATAVSTTGQGIAGDAQGGTGGNISSTAVSSSSDNSFWKTLIENVKEILNQESSDDTVQFTQVVANPLSGVLMVNANQKQHSQVQKFIDQVLANAQRQVLIEATIVEVDLSDQYQAGVDWSGLASRSNNALTTDSNPVGGSLTDSILRFTRSTTNLDISFGVSMLETFGNVHVLSSPKIIAINNQTALLKVVDEKVYFNISVEIEQDKDTNSRIEKYSTDIHTVPVGLIMSVTPQINENGTVTMNIRPTITRITRYVSDPTPKLQDADFENLIPEIQVREIESLLQVNNGQTVILGGLMQNKEDKSTSGVPLLSSLPYIGGLFRYKNDELTKSELVIFLRPVVVHNGDINRDLHEYRQYLPKEMGENSDQHTLPEQNINTLGIKGADHESVNRRT